ncbi:type IV toxin-antitoxin system AbiEi family antitoxin domain-containing protein [Rhodococcus sp. ANT_H53B]|uniref:type IV toxin-antitoxin system AbiEi family antitoxin domain-containing protein n=1 Tax=Rhodococcus sp. ANT_H53B TaxID=2597357 RepID=UPI0011EF4F30|nr:type IV toxin-antitoxin system AbiEi family antitoxin domain-containing protein [Rhodococcus sp. ANT_H53B]KAA0924011.1 type IV toxin-antitoxin system AbiEi family antitoxin domain-containing protein [Rhodococcus sp. ANT_H53B]
MDNEETRLLRSLLDTQHGVLTTVQLRACGFTPKAIRHHVETGQWLRVFRNVICLTNGPLNREMELQAALLYGGGAAILSHETAAQQWGMMRELAGPIHVTVPRACSAISLPPTMRHVLIRPTSLSNARIHPGVVVHRSLAIEHIGVDTEPRRTSKEDTAMDLAVAAPTAHEGAAAFVSAMTNGRVSVSAMRRKIELRRPRRYKKILLDALSMLAGGVQSVLEFRYATDVERAHGLPSGRRQAPHHVGDRVLFEDVEYSESGLIVRLDGQQFHSARNVRFRDRLRDNAAELSDRPRLVYGWQEVSRDPCGVYREVREVLVREGWTDTSYQCERCAVARSGAAQGT